MIRKIVLPILLWSVATTSEAQFNNERIANEFKQNLNSYLEAYLRPAFDGTANISPLLWNLPYENSKSYNFSINLNTGASFLPITMANFDFFSLDRTQNFELKNPGNNILPTIVGGETDNEIYFYVTDNNGNRVFDPIRGHHVRAEIPANDGFDIGVTLIPTAAVQLGAWLPVHTGIGLRYIPTIIGDDIQFGSFGFSLQHNPLGWFDLPIDVIVGYSFNQLTFVGKNFVEDANPNQFILESRTNTIDLTITKRFSFIKPYIQLNYINNVSSADLKGTFNYTFSDYLGVPAGVLQNLRFSVTDPVSFSRSNQFFNAGVGALLTWKSFFMNTHLMFGKFQNVAVSLGYQTSI